MSTASYLIKKIIYILITLWVVVTVTFCMMKAIPGDPFSQEKAIPKEILDALYEHYGLNAPLHEQYFRYVKGIATFNFGPSFKYKGRDVNDIIASGLPVSALLGLEALAISIGLGVFLGALAALRQNQWQDRLAMLIAVIGTSVPSFILATLLQYIFALKLQWLPVARWGNFTQSILPALSLAALPTAFIARLSRSSILEVLQQDYIKTAESKGLSERQVLTRHILRNASLPIVSYLGQLTVNVFVGSFIIERIFGIPGLGQWFVTSVTNRDYTVIMGLTVFYSILLLAAIFLVDLAYLWIDPRLRSGRTP